MKHSLASIPDAAEFVAAADALAHDVEAIYGTGLAALARYRRARGTK